MTEVRVLIFSRDRAMQVDATLRSMLAHCRDAAQAEFNVLYRATSAVHARQYTSLTAEYSAVKFVKQAGFRNDTFTILDPYAKHSEADSRYRTLVKLGGVNLGSQRRLRRLWQLTAGRLQTAIIRELSPLPSEELYVLFLTDDNLFVRDFSLAGAVEALRATPRALGFSLRLGRNTTYCYSMDRPQALPPFHAFGDQILSYAWPSAEYDFAYPLEVSSSIYRARQIVPFMLQLQFGNPNELEQAMASSSLAFRRDFPVLLCYARSATFCNPVNIVQSTFDNRRGSQTGYAADLLAERFERGERIRVESYNGFVPSACHQEVDLIFDRAGGQPR